jgi:hypothetical protein
LASGSQNPKIELAALGGQLLLLRGLGKDAEGIILLDLELSYYFYSSFMVSPIEYL